MPLRLRLDGLVLEQKHELHVTCSTTPRPRRARRLDPPAVADAFAAFDWRMIPTQRYALVHKTKDEWDGPLQAWAVIEHLQMPAFAAFRDRLAQASGLALDCGIPHVTLYVAGDPAGIGLPDLATWRACFVREVGGDEVRRRAVPGPTRRCRYRRASGEGTTANPGYPLAGGSTGGPSCPMILGIAPTTTSANSVVMSATISMPMPAAMPTAEVIQMPAAVVSPSTRAPLSILMMAPAPRKPMPDTMPCITRVMSAIGTSAMAGARTNRADPIDTRMWVLNPASGPCAHARSRSARRGPPR